MMVHIKSEYSIRDEDLPLLDEKKMRWWMKSEDTKENPWVRFHEQQLGNSLLDVEVDLAPGRYSAGVGDYNITNDKGWHVSQRLYFYLVPDGTVIYCRKFADLPTYDEVIDMADGDYVPEEKVQQTPKGIEVYGKQPAKGIVDFDKIEKTMTLVVVPYIRFCKFPRVQTIEDTDEIFFLKKIIEIRGTVCSDFKEIKPDAGYKCDNCAYAEELYIDEKVVNN